MTKHLMFVKIMREVRKDVWYMTHVRDRGKSRNSTNLPGYVTFYIFWQIYI